MLRGDHPEVFAMTQPQEQVRFPLPAPPSLYHPSPELGELRETQPVTRVTMPDGKIAWLVTRYADVRQVLIDSRFSRAAATAPDAPQVGLGQLATQSLMGMDPPEHTRIRKLVARAFTARRVEELRPRVSKLVDELLDRVVSLPPPVDLVENFSFPLPVQVICELLGVPAQDRHTFHSWSDAMMGDIHRDPKQMEAAFAAMGQYLGGLIATKRAEPADDLMTALIAARDEHDRLSEQELVTLCIGLLVGGHETTANQINMFLLTLLHYPEELARLRAQPESVPGAVEELMRFTQLGEAAAGMPRITTEPVELGGVTIPAGAAVLPAMGAANRDPRSFPDPDRLDLTRAVNQHLSFGAGVHHCLGAQLARMELQEALSGLLRRMPTVRVVVPDSELRFKQGMILRSLEALPVAW
jgi:cytochrome P450